MSQETSITTINSAEIKSHIMTIETPIQHIILESGKRIDQLYYVLRINDLQLKTDGSVEGVAKLTLLKIVKKEILPKRHLLDVILCRTKENLEKQIREEYVKLWCYTANDWNDYRERFDKIGIIRIPIDTKDIASAYYCQSTIKALKCKFLNYQGIDVQHQLIEDLMVEALAPFVETWSGYLRR